MGLLLTLVTCRDGSGPSLHYARVAVAPVFPSEATVAAFGLSIDRVRFVVVRSVAPPDTLADTTVDLPPDAQILDLNLRVPIVTSPETVLVSIVALAGAVPLFQGAAPVEVSSGVTSEPTEISVATYVGPGAGVDSIAISPRAPFIYFGDSLRFQVVAFQAGAPVPDFYVSWSTSDTALAHVNGIGSLRAPAWRTNVWVIARTPGAVADSVTATFQPIPSQLVVIAGGGQTGPVSLPLATQLEVEVRGADNLPVFGVAVRFRSLSGGRPSDTTVTSDLAGRASVTGVLGPTPGAQSYQATLPAFPGVTAAAFTATATGVVISPATSLLTVASGSVLSGNTVKLRLQAKDAGGNDITTGGAIVAFNRSGGTSTGTISTTADSGNGVYTAAFTGVLAGTATAIGATINGAPVTRTAPTISVFPGAISPSASPVTISNGTVTSGAVVTLHLRGRDAAGNNVTTGGAIVVFSSSGGTSTGTISATADSGTGGYTATFTGALAGTGTSIGASIDGTPVTTVKPTVVVTPGTPAQLLFVVAPAFAATGVVMSPAVQVGARDLAGNATPAYAGDVTIAIGTNPGSGSLAGTLTHTASGGVATFDDLAIDLPGIGYTLGATASGLATATSTPFDVVPPSGTIVWAAATSGNWSNPANWVGGVVPGPTETAAIMVPGTYTVTLDVNDTIGGLQLGGSSGTQTLLAASKTLRVSGTSQVNANGLLWLKASTLAGGTLSDAGQVFVEGSTSITTGLTTTSGSLIRLQGNGSYSTAALTVANSFTNNGSIVLTDSTSSYGAILNVTTGTLTNAPTGTIDAAVGTGGQRTLGAQLDNQGTLTVRRALTLSRASAAHTSSGAINLTGASLTVGQSGTLPSFTITGGTITSGAGDSLKVTSGTFRYNGGSITGGTLSLSSVAVSASQSFSTATAGLSLAGTTWSGSGTVTIAPATTVVWRASTISAPLHNQGTLLVNGSSALNGPVSNDAGATLQLEGNGSYSTAVLAVANSFTNTGAIVLTDITSSYGAMLNMPAGATLTNAAGATIDAAVGTGGPRTLGLQLDNQGTVTLHRSLTLSRASAAHTNSGLIDITSGNLSVSQSGTSPSFSNAAGSITMGASDSLLVSSGSFTWNGGAITGGTLSFASTAVTLAQDFSTATAGLSLASTTWSGTGTLTVAPSTGVVWRASTISAPLVNQGTLIINGSSAFNGPFSNASGATLQLQGNGSYSSAVLAVANSFTNNGAIVLTDVTSSYGATLNMPSTRLTNASGATIDAAVGQAGPRTLAVELDNQGTVTLHRGLTLGRASAAHLNSGTIDLVGGDLTISQSGTAPSFTNTGAINIGTGDSVKVSSGAFNYTSGTISGAGTFSVTSVNITAAQSFSTATAALSLASSTWGGSGTLTVASGTSLLVRASTINSALLNQGLLVVNGASAFNGSVTNPAGATLRVQGNGSYGVGSLSIATAFTNAGTIELTDTTSSYGATLSVSLTQPFINAAGGTIAALQGFNGHRFIFAQLDNRGTVSVATAPNQPLTFAAGGVSHQNSGTIVITSGNLLISGPGESFTNTGAISVGAGDTLRMTNGSFTHNGGTLGGAGALSLESATTGAFNVAQSIASMLLTNSTASFATPQSTGATGFQFSSSTINGPGLLTNDLGRFLNVRSSTINADLDNHGTLLVNGSSAFNGVLTTGDTSLIQVQGNGTNSTGTMTVLNGFTNRGVIELSDIVSSYGATLNVTNGTLTNAPGASINALAGTNGARTLGAMLDNQGSLSVALAPTGTLTLNHGGADHRNTGTIDVSGGDFVITQSGTTPSFSNAGAITVGSGDTLRINGGAFTHASGTAGGAGALVLFNVNPASFSVDQSFGAMTVTSSTVAFATPQNTTATGFDFTGSFVDGPGPITNEAGNTLPLHSTVMRTALRNFGTILTTGATSFTDTLTTVAGSLIRIQGNGTYGSANLTVTKGFENAGTVELTDTTLAYGSTLTVPNGKLLNLSSGLISAAPGANGSRTLTAAVDNQGAVAVALQPGRDLLINQAGAVHANSGTIDVTSGDLAITGAASFQNVGAINIGGGDTLSITNGAFSYDAGTLGVGTLVLSSVNPANFNTSHTLSSIVLNNTTANFAPAQSTAATAFALTGSVLGGPGTLTNDAGQTMKMRSSGISAPFVNQGTLIANGASSLDALTTVAGSTLRVEGDGTSGVATLTVTGGMVNSGGIELTDVGSAYGATLVVKTLPLVNAGTIAILPGANGPRTIDVVRLDNQGTFTANQPVTISHPDAQHTNRGTFKVKAGAITFAQSGTNESFTNLAGGIIDIDAGTVFRVTNGPVSNALGGKILGFGTLDVRPPAVFSNDGEILPGASPGKLTIAGNMQIPTSGIITIELGGPTPGAEYDQLAITGAAIFAEGTLNVSTIGAFDPKGLSFDVMTFGPGSTTGPIRTVNLPPLCSSGQVVNTGTSLRVTCP